MTPTIIQLISAALFAMAILHTFSTQFFEHLAHARPTHARLWHLLGEVEVVFGFWALVLMATMFVTDNAALTYLGSLVEGLSDSFKYALVAGGGLTIIRLALPSCGDIMRMKRYAPGYY